MLGADETLRYGCREHLDQWRIETLDVEQHHWLADEAELIPGQHFEQLFEGSETSGERDEPVGEFGHPRLATVHRISNLQLGQAQVADLRGDEALRDDADHVAAAGQHCVGDGSHQTQATPSVDEADAASCHRRAQVGRCLQVGGRVADVRAAIHAQVDLGHTSSLAPDAVDHGD